MQEAEIVTEFIKWSWQSSVWFLLRKLITESADVRQVEDVRKFKCSSRRIMRNHHGITKQEYWVRSRGDWQLRINL